LAITDVYQYAHLSERGHPRRSRRAGRDPKMMSRLCAVQRVAAYIMTRDAFQRCFDMRQADHRRNQRQNRLPWETTALAAAKCIENMETRPQHHSRPRDWMNAGNPFNTGSGTCRSHVTVAITNSNNNQVLTKIVRGDRRHRSESCRGHPGIRSGGRSLPGKSWDRSIFSPFGCCSGWRRG